MNNNLIFESAKLRINFLSHNCSDNNVAAIFDKKATRQHTVEFFCSFMNYSFVFITFAAVKTDSSLLNHKKRGLRDSL